MPHTIFITGGTGYIGRRLIPELLGRGHTVRALVRGGSESKLTGGAEPVVGNSLDRSSFAEQVPPSDTFIQLVGVAHPSPSKAQEFQSVDLVSIRQSVTAARDARVAFPATRDTARRLYPVPLRSVVRAIADAVEAPPQDIRIVEAPEMREGH